MQSIIARMKPYMFEYNSTTPKIPVPELVPVPATLVPVPATLVPATLVPVPATLVPVPATLAPVPATLAPVPVPKAEPKNSFFTPFPKDKLFWCFYIFLKGHEDYELYKTNSFAIEKQIKIEAVEKLKSIKTKLKEFKLTRTELEDDLVNQPKISIKGLYALCLVHNISIIYVFGRKFCIINGNTSEEKKTFFICQNNKKEDSIQWVDNADLFIANLKLEYWFIENIKKPLNAPSAYTIKDLQEICTRLHIDLQLSIDDKIKPKTKKILYEDILKNI